MEPTVSIIVPVYNAKSTLRRCVDSILDQEYEDYELLLVDDGSRDESGSLCDAYAARDRRIRVFHKENGGVSAARNTGIRRTQAPMVLILDGDDKLEPMYIEQVSQMLRDHPSMIAASSWMHTFGVLDAIVCPSGGILSVFLARN